MHQQSLILVSQKKQYIVNRVRNFDHSAIDLILEIANQYSVIVILEKYRHTFDKSSVL